MSIDAPVYEAHPYQEGFAPEDLNVPEAVETVRFIGARNAAKGLLYVTALTLTGLNLGQMIDEPADEAYREALAEASDRRSSYIEYAEADVDEAEAGVEEVETTFENAPDCLFLIRRYGPFGEEAATRADQLVTILEARENTGVCSAQNNRPEDLLDWIDYVNYWDRDLSSARADLKEEVDTPVVDYVNDVIEARASGDPFTVTLGAIGLVAGLVVLKKGRKGYFSSEDSIAQARIKRELRHHLDPKTYLTERSPVATHQKLKEDARQALENYKKTQPQQARLFAPPRAERRARAKQAAKY